MSYNDYNRPDSENRDYGYSYSYAPPAPKKKNTGLRLVALCLVFALVGGLIGGIAVSYGSGTLGGNTSVIYQGDRLNQEVKMVSVDSRTQLSLPELYAACAPSTVGISVEHVMTNYFGQKVAGAAAGSGFVITSDGYIVTNYHVVYNEDTDSISDNIKVTFIDGTEHQAAYIGGEQENDIAVLKIEAENLTPVVIGKSANMNVGESVAAIGNPLGELTFSLTDGIISALDRSITTSDGTVMNMIQTNTAINPGNSGGPLFNMYGEVIGITTSKYLSASDGTSVEGLGFIIPIDDVTEMLADIIENGYVTGKPYLGIVVSTVTDSESMRYNLPVGANVLGVVDDACSDRAGLQTGDIITSANGVEVNGHAALIEVKNQLKAGDTMNLTVYRNGETQNITIVMDESTPELEAKTAALSEEISQTQNSNSNSNNGNGYYYNWPFNIW